MEEKNCFVLFELILISQPLVYLVTAFVPSEMACLANSPGRRNLTAVWISLELRVLLLLNLTNLLASRAILSKISLMNEFMMFIAFLETPISGCTYLKTLQIQRAKVSYLLLAFFLSSPPFLVLTVLTVFLAASAFGDFDGAIFINLNINFIIQYLMRRSCNLIG